MNNANLDNEYSYLGTQHKYIDKNWNQIDTAASKIKAVINNWDYLGSIENTVQSIKHRNYTLHQLQ